MKKMVVLIALLLLTYYAFAMPTTTGVIVTKGGEVKPHDSLKMNFALDPHFIYTTTCIIESPHFETNRILGKFETSHSGFSYYECLFNGKPMRNGFFLLNQPENTLMITPDSSTYPVKDILFRNSDSIDSYSVRECVSTLRID